MTAEDPGSAASVVPTLQSNPAGRTPVQQIHETEPAHEPGRLQLHKSSSLPFVWPLLAAASASEAAASIFSEFAHGLVRDESVQARGPEPGWETPHRVSLELQTMQLRDFSGGEDGTAALICAPYALHGSSAADFAPGHSLVEALRSSGVRRLSATDWRSATPDMQFLPIDAYLADLNVAVDDVGPPVDLIGLCQGGWLALLYAARFPHKVRRLVLAGAPVDVNAAQSTISKLAAEVPLERFEQLVRLGDGRVPGHRVLELWGNALDAREADQVLQLPAGIESSRRRELERRFRIWYDWTVDLPGTYYLQVVSWLFKQNQIAEGRFVALGRRIDLRDLRAPVFLLAARDDELVATQQLMATAWLIGTPPHAIETAIAPCGHLSLFMGAETLQRIWPRIARWLARDFHLAQVS